MTAIHSTLHTSYGAKSCELNAMKMTVMGRDANLSQAYQRGWSAYSNRRHYPPLLKETHTHIHTHTQLPKTNQTLNLLAHTSINQGADGQNLQTYTLLNSKLIFATSLKIKAYTFA